MVSLAAIRTSNDRVASTLPSGLTAVFVGATSGIGETSLKQFAKYAKQPHIYFMGRSEEAGKRITADLAALNGEGKYVFIKSDVSLLKNVDSVCRDIKSKETAINLLFISAGTLISGTSEHFSVPCRCILLDTDCTSQRRKRDCTSSWR
jgi:short-subunit dehydrogenase